MKSFLTFVVLIKMLQDSNQVDYMFTVDYTEYNHYYENFKDNLKAFIEDLIDSMIADCKKGGKLPHP